MKKKSGRVGKTKTTWDERNKNRGVYFRVDLADVENDRIHLKKSTSVGKELA